MIVRSGAIAFCATFLKKLIGLIVGAVVGSTAGAVGSAVIGGLMMLAFEGRRHALGGAVRGTVVGGVGGAIVGALYGLRFVPRFFGDDANRTAGMSPGRSSWGPVLGALLGLALDGAAFLWLTSAFRQQSREHPGPSGASQGVGVFYLLLLLAAPVLALIGWAFGSAIVAPVNVPQPMDHAEPPRSDRVTISRSQIIAVAIVSFCLAFLPLPLSWALTALGITTNPWGKHFVGLVVLPPIGVLLYLALMRMFGRQAP